MSHSFLFRSCVLFACVVCLASVSVAAQGSPAEDDAWTPPRTENGRPDLQGVWDFRTLTPLQRPTSQESAVLTEEEAAEVESSSAERAIKADEASEVRSEPLPAGGNVGAYNNYWFDRGARVVDDHRTSLIVDPPNGRIPDRLPGVQEQVAGDDKPSDRPVRLRVGGIGLDGPEDRGTSERCMLGFNAGPPITPGGYNQNVQIFQTADYVAILTEMVHDTRIVPLDGRPHLPDGIRQWKGDSRGYWDGDTLVVETRNFTDKTPSFSANVVTSYGSGESMNLTERFRRVDDDTLLYEFTINDPTTFTSPFTAILQMKQNEWPLFEYACHEGNYGLYNLLSGARAKERAEAQESSGD